MKQILKKEIGVKMRKLRKSLNLTQAEMVSHFDVGRANYSRIEKGEVFPNVAILHTLKTQFKVSLDWLICNEGRMTLGAEDEAQGTNVDQDEMNDLLRHIQNLPMVKHAVLGFFLEYKVKNNKLIQQLWAELDQQTSQSASQES